MSTTLPASFACLALGLALSGALAAQVPPAMPDGPREVPGIEIEDPTPAQVTALARLGRLSGRATWTIKQIQGTRLELEPLFDWVGSVPEGVEPPLPADVTALTDRAVAADRTLLGLLEKIGDPAPEEPGAGGTDTVLDALREAQRLVVSGAAAGGEPERSDDLVRRAEGGLVEALEGYRRFLAEDLPALERAADALEAERRSAERDALVATGVPAPEACICTFPCADAPYTGQAVKQFSSSSGGATYKLRAAGFNAREVRIQCTVRANARRGSDKVYLSHDANLTLISSSGPYTVRPGEPARIGIRGCIARFGDNASFRIYDLVSVPGLVFTVDCRNP
jgi:hypothetical protein